MDDRTKCLGEQRVSADWNDCYFLTMSTMSSTKAARTAAVVLAVVATAVGSWGALGGGVSAAAPEDATPLEYGQTRDVASVPGPGQPEGIAVDPQDGSVWSGSNRPYSSGTLWHWDSAGTLIDTVSLAGHVPAEHGINGVTLDGDGRIYALDYSGSRAVRVDPATGDQSVYATFADLPPCGGAPTQPCEPSLVDRPAWPNWATFDEAGNLYVSDLNQATIWVVPPGGGAAQIWYQHPDFASIYSVNGMQFDAAGRLTFVVTLSLAADIETIARGSIYNIAVDPDGSPGELRRIAVTGLGDGLAIGSSGRIYLASSSPLDNSVQVIDPNLGVMTDSIPHLPERYARSTPYATPASLGFRGTSLILSNHGLFALDPRQYAILELGVGETGLALNYPRGLA